VNDDNDKVESYVNDKSEMRGHVKLITDGFWLQCATKDKNYILKIFNK
jgi:hypothetical protein